MKKFLLIISLTAICLTGCFESEQDVTINANGSGIYKNTVDMSGLFDMMQMMASMDTSADNKFKGLGDKDTDSTISLKSFTDTATSLTAEQKALLENGTIHLNMNQEDKVFKITMTYPFKKIEDIEKIVELQQGDKGFNPLAKPKNGGDMSAMDNMDIPSPEKMMKMTFKNGLIERKIDSEKLNDFKNNEQFKEVGKAEEMMETMKFTSVIHLPKAAKNIKGEKLTASADKKTITVKYTLLDLIKNPSALEFRVEY